MRRISIIFISAMILISCGRRSTGSDPVTLDELTIEVYESSRELGYTNKEAGFYYTESNRDQSSGWQGWHVMSKKILDDYTLAIDGKDLLKRDVQLTLAKPHQFTRSYAAGAQETVTLLDSVNVLVVELDRVKGATVTIRPLFTESMDSGDYLVNSTGSSVFIAKKSHPHGTPREDYPAWIGVTIVGNESRVSPEPSVRSHRFAPAFVEAPLTDGKAVAILVAGNTLEETESLLKNVSTEFQSMIEARKNRMEAVLARAFVRTDNERFDKALHWAILSMDALVMNQGRKGIFAGLPWFSNYWGRDSFISLPGATLVTGNFSEAKAILRSFSEWQEKESGNRMYGRIPNLVTPTSISYNTTDGTPWFVIALGDYVTATGDTSFAREMFPAVQRSVEGSMKYRVDKNLLLVHEDAETWMDAVGPGGPWSPRGNRANDIQALWYKQLLVASWMAHMVGDSRSFSRWLGAAESVRLSFNRLFVDADSSIVYDYLQADGTPSRQLRPNQIFALDLIDNQKTQFDVFRKYTESLVYAHGVASLSQEDGNFHPFHHYEPIYVQDAAYHNGIVWTWLAGPWISAATKFGYSDLTYQVTDNMIHQILDRGAVGTLSELLDAAPREGELEPRLSGTFSQAWSLAEFIRVAYQDYLGVTTDVVEKRIEIHPHLPSTIRHATFRIPFGATEIGAQLQAHSSEGTITLTSPTYAPTIDVIMTWRLGNVEQSFAYMLTPGSTAVLTITDDRVSVEDALGVRTNQMNVRRIVEDGSATSPITLAAPVIRPELASMKTPSHRLLTNPEIKASKTDVQLLYEATDAENDDTGTGSYVYPSTPNLRSGSLDVKRFSVSIDDSNAHFLLEFRSLSNPGWHPEYGFQLTFAAIAIDKDGKAGSGQNLIGRNARYTLLSGLGYESILFVGGGIRLEDAEGNVLAEYQPVPGDEKNPLGNVAEKSISFSVPIELLGQPQSSWKYTVLIGAQDDHGGAGIGDFRTVDARASEWSGGGKKKSIESNIYDFIKPKH